VSERGVMTAAVRRTGGSATWEQTLAQLLRDLLGQGAAERVEAVVFDVSEVLTPDDRKRVLIRVEPRRPMSRAFELAPRTGWPAVSHVLHVPGGHMSTGEELVSLELEPLTEFCAQAEPGLDYVVTEAGALSASEHEERVADYLFEHAAPRRVELSHEFFGQGFETREHSASVNSILRDAAEVIAETTGLICEEVVPEARLYVVQNDGGAAPISRLALAPVHSLHSAAATAMLGAAALTHRTEGQVALLSPEHRVTATIKRGVLTVDPYQRGENGTLLATQTARVQPVTPVMVQSLGEDVAVVCLPEADTSDLEPGRGLRVEESLDVVALGAALAPLADWVNRVITIRGGQDPTPHLEEAEALVSARLLAQGAAPNNIEIIESRFVTTAYENSLIASVRVRGVSREQRHETLC
jgi:hypothetical protein